jgi:hypothetical protein
MGAGLSCTTSREKHLEEVEEGSENFGGKGKQGRYRSICNRGKQLQRHDHVACLHTLASAATAIGISPCRGARACLPVAASQTDTQSASKICSKVLAVESQEVCWIREKNMMMKCHEKKTGQKLSNLS